ncbi:MAG: L,D-transpeptidase [Candidatus Nanopelagicales bacterium]
MPVDPASLVAMSGLTARDLPDDAELIAETSPAADPAAYDAPVDVPAPFWTQPVTADADPAPVHQVEHVSNVGIGLVAASPEVVEVDPDAPTGPRGALPSLPSLASVSLATRAFAARHLPAAPLAAFRDPTSALHPSSWRMPDLGTFPTLDATARRRLALLAGSSVAAGLACGLAVPVAAEAAPATSGTVPTGTTGPAEAQLLAAPSPFASLLTDAPSSSSGGAVVVAAAKPAAKPAPATPAAAKPAAAKPSAAKPATKPAAAKPAATKPAATKPAPATPMPGGSGPGGSGSGGSGGADGAAALLATLLGPASTPFSASPGPAPAAGPVATDPPAAPPSAAPAPSASTSAPAAPVAVPSTSAPTAAPAAAPVAPAAPASASPSAAATLPGRTTAAAVVVVSDPAPPHPGRPAPAVVVSKPAWKPTRPLPAHSGTGRRIVYAERTAHLWIVGADGTVLRDYKVTGRADRPRPGTYKVFSKSRTTSNPKEKLTFDLMVRFTHGVTGAPIGFHTIPKTYSGHPIQSEKDLGKAIGMGGCVRQSRVDAEWLYAWSRVGDTVVVLH